MIERATEFGSAGHPLLIKASGRMPETIFLPTTAGAEVLDWVSAG